jgi:hypothetical protein
MTHLRSKQSRQKRTQRKKLSFEQKLKEKDLARSIVKELNIKDYTTGEIAFTIEMEKTVTEQLKHTFHGVIPVHAISHDFGEVLNRGIDPCWWR